MFKHKKTELPDRILISKTLKKLVDKVSDSKTSVFELIEDFQENAILLTIIFFAIPIACPLPLPPGLATILGVPLIILSIQLAFGSKKVRFPQKISNCRIKNSTLAVIANKIMPVVVAIERYVKPRTEFAKSIYCEQIIGLFCLISSIAASIPLPFTKGIPAFSIIVMVLGLLNRDGVAMIVGVIIAMVGILISTSAILASMIAIKYLFHNNIF